MIKLPVGFTNEFIHQDKEYEGLNEHTWLCTYNNTYTTLDLRNLSIQVVWDKDYLCVLPYKSISRKTVGLVFFHKDSNNKTVCDAIPLVKYKVCSGVNMYWLRLNAGTWGSIGWWRWAVGIENKPPLIKTLLDYLPQINSVGVRGINGKEMLRLIGNTETWVVNIGEAHLFPHGVHPVMVQNNYTGRVSKVLAVYNRWDKHEVIDRSVDFGWLIGERLGIEIFSTFKMSLSKYNTWRIV